jgi:hypothetical protein
LSRIGVTYSQVLLSQGTTTIYNIDLSATKGVNDGTYRLSNAPGYDLRKNHPIGVNENSLGSLISEGLYFRHLGWSLSRERRDRGDGPEKIPLVIPGLTRNPGIFVSVL